MSLSRPRSTNPATRFFSWAGGEGNVTYYDKENEENVIVDLPFKFVVLDELNTVKGFDPSTNKGFYSNEVRNIKEDILVVKSNGKEVARGIWDNLKNLKGDGAKYAKSIYIAFFDESNELVVGNLSVSGAALTAWIEFNRHYNIQKGAVKIAGAVAKKKGATNYFEPEFVGMNVSEETWAQATKLDEQLQDYLDSYIARGGEIEAEVVADDYEGDDGPIKSKADEAEAPAKTTPKNEEPEEKPIDLAEVPF